MWLNDTVHFWLRGRKEHTYMLWGDFEKGRYLHHSNNTWFIFSECKKQVITRLVRAGEWYRPSPRIYPRAKALGADTGVAGLYHSPALTRTCNNLYIPFIPS